MKFRNTVILLVIFAALLAYFLFLEKDQNSATTSAPTPTSTNVYTFASNDVVELNLTDGTRTTTLQRNNDAAPWEIVAPSPNPGDSVKINAVVQQLSSLTASRVFTDSASTSDLSAFGLDKPKLDATVKLKDGTQYLLHLGDKTPDNTNVYVQKPDDKSIYLVSATLADDSTGMLDKPPVALPTPTPTATATLTATFGITATAPVTSSTPATGTISATSPVTATAAVTSTSAMTSTAPAPAAPVATVAVPATATPEATPTAEATATPALTPTIEATITPSVSATAVITATPAVSPTP